MQQENRRREAAPVRVFQISTICPFCLADKGQLDCPHFVPPDPDDPSDWDRRHFVFERSPFDGPDGPAAAAKAA